MKADDFLDLRGFTLGLCKFGPLLEEIMATPLQACTIKDVREKSLDFLARVSAQGI